jgi:hypothetical protein
MIGPAAAALIGLILLATGAAVGVVIGLALVAAGLIRGGPRIRRYIRGCALADPKPSDHQIDTWLAESIEPICEDGFRRLDIVHSDLVDKDAPPLVVVGFPNDLPDFLAPDGRKYPIPRDLGSVWHAVKTARLGPPTTTSWSST